MATISTHTAAQQPTVLCLQDVSSQQLRVLLARVRLTVVDVALSHPIPGSYWGDSEAGLVADALYVRADTPLHSLLHEAAHYICMDGQRRASLQREAGGDDAEENAVCYLQILLADHVAGFSRARMLDDMDAWGYTFRLGSARAWFEHEADDARAWLVGADLIDAHAQPNWRVRE